MWLTWFIKGAFSIDDDDDSENVRYVEKFLFHSLRTKGNNNVK